MNYTMAMDTSYDCQLQQEIPLPNGWAKGSVSKISYYVYICILEYLKSQLLLVIYFVFLLRKQSHINV